MIPKTIHYLWLSDEKPDNVIACLDSWKRHLTGYEIIEWNKSNFPYNDFTWTREAFSVQKWAFVTDFFRLWVLKNYGGIYLDADMVVRNNFDDFLHHKMFIGTEWMSLLGPHVIGSEASHPFIEKCLNFYESHHFIENGEIQDKIIMPHIITKIFMTAYKISGKIAFFDNKPFQIGDIAIYNDTFFTINVYNGCNVSYHNCFGSWRNENSKIPNQPFKNSQYYFLARFFTYEYSSQNKIARYIKPFLPGFVFSWYYNRKMKMKTNLSVKNAKL